MAEHASIYEVALQMVADGDAASEIEKVNQKLERLKKVAEESGDRMHVSLVEKAQEAALRVSELTDKLEDAKKAAEDVRIGGDSASVAAAEGAVKGLESALGGAKSELGDAMAAWEDYVGSLEDADDVMGKVAEAMKGPEDEAKELAQSFLDSAEQGDLLGTASKGAQLWLVKLGVSAKTAGLLVKGAFGLIGAAASFVIGLITKYIQKQREARAETQKFYDEVSERTSGVTAKFIELQTAWNGVADTMEGRQQFIRDNADRFKELGLQIRDVNEAERILSENADLYIQAQIRKAQADVYRAQAQDKIKQIVDLTQKRDAGGTVKVNDIAEIDGEQYSVVREVDAKDYYQGQINALNEELRKDFQTVLKTTEEATALQRQAAGDYYGVWLDESKKSKDDGKPVKDTAKDVLEAARQANQKALDTALASARKSAADAEVSAIEDEGARTLAALRLKHRNEIEELERQKAELERLAAELGISLDFDFDALMANTEARQTRERRSAFGKNALPELKRMDTRKDGLAGVNPAASSGQADVSPDKGSIKEWQELYRTLGDVKDEFESIGESVDGTVGDMMQGAGQMVASVLSMIDGIVTLQNTSVEGMKGTAEGAAASIAAVEKASVILAVISAAIQIIQKIVGLVKKLQEANDWLYEFNAEAEKLNRELARVKLNARLETDRNSVFGENAWGNAVKNVDAARDALEKYNESLDRLRHRDWTVFGVRLGTIDYSSVEQAIGDMQLQMRHATWFRGAKYKSLKDAVPELFGDDGKVDKDALKEFIGSDMFGKLSEENQKYLKELANSWEDYEKAMESVRDYLEDVFGDMGSGLSDALTDAFRNGTDAAEEFGKTADEILENMIQQIAYNAVFSKMFDQAQADMEAIMGDQGLTDEERIRLLTERVRKVQEDALSKQDSYNAILGIGRDSGLFGSDSEREGLSKGIATASQDSVDELNGRATAIQGYTYNIQENTAALVRHSASMLEHLSGIRDNTARLEAIEKIARDIRDHGVKAL